VVVVTAALAAAVAGVWVGVCVAGRGGGVQHPLPEVLEIGRLHGQGTVRFHWAAMIKI